MADSSLPYSMLKVVRIHAKRSQRYLLHQLSPAVQAICEAKPDIIHRVISGVAATRAMNKKASPIPLSLIGRRAAVS
ncbi:MAG: hypothetical protein AAGD09_10445 [Cyanobacteria bacterium P01_F01_bin.56]